MKITNVQMLNIWAVFNNKYENAEDIKTKWNIMEISKSIYDIKSRFETEKNSIVEKYGEVNKEGFKTLSLDDEHIKELFMCEAEVSPIPLEDLDKLHLSLEEMMILKPIIEI